MLRHWFYIYTEALNVFHPLCYFYMCWDSSLQEVGLLVLLRIIIQTFGRYEVEAPFELQTISVQNYFQIIYQSHCKVAELSSFATFTFLKSAHSCYNLWEIRFFTRVFLLKKVGKCCWSWQILGSLWRGF